MKPPAEDTILSWLNTFFTLFFYNAAAREVIEVCGGIIDRVRDKLEFFFEEHVYENALKQGQLPQPMIGFQRVIQRAAQNVQSSGK